MTVDPFALEEYRRVTRRQEAHEARQHQMLALSVTGLAAVIGFSDKLPHPLIPYILAPLLLLTSQIAMSNREMGLFNAAFLMVHFQRYYPVLVYEGAYNSVFLSVRRNRLWRYVRTVLAFASNDFVLLNAVALAATLYFAADFVLASFGAGHRTKVLAYALPLAFIHTASLALICRGLTQSVSQLQRDILRRAALAEKSGPNVTTSVG